MTDPRIIIRGQAVSGADGRLTVMVVEDEMLIGMDLAMLIEEWGHIAVGPFKSVPQALSEIERARPDFGVLDVNLGHGETSAPVAQALSDLGVPFIFLTGYDPTRLPDDPVVRDAPHLRKPVSENALREILDAGAAASRTNRGA